MSNPGDIYAMNANVSSLTPLISGLDEPGGPAWSPDGSKIAFTARTFVASVGQTRQHVFVMTNTGANPTELVPLSTDMESPTWSADGKWMVYAQTDGTADGALSFSSAFPTKVVNSAVLRSNGVQILGAEPSFSPDGQKIVFSRSGVDAGIFVMTLDANWIFNGTATAVTKLAGAAGVTWSHPVFSPDGQKIVFSLRDDDPAGEIFVMNADGTGVKRLTSRLGLDADPSWSPDGRRIAFASDRSGTIQVWSMNASGGSLRRLTDLNSVAAQPAYSH